tara:strand:- start:746 stop:1711 length:966 start_codon:yes stop_codon:yes gene_type:complete
MKTKQSKIFCTLGPSSLNKKFLKLSSGKVSLLRLNMSHLSLGKLKKSINFIRKYTKTPICIDTEGAQIRTKVKRSSKLKKNSSIIINKKLKNFSLYPPEVFDQLKKNDILEIGFEGLIIKVIKKTEDKILSKVISEGALKNNKGVHLVNRKIKLNFITEKDRKAIEISKKLKINNFALSFTNSVQDIDKFEKLLHNKNKIYKIETKKAIDSLDSIISKGQKFLIDRGDLSKEISIQMLPVVQRKILKKSKGKRKEVYVATNFLESMLENRYPTRGEVNDIYNTLEMGSAGLVLAAETAIGKYPMECVSFLKKIINTFKKFQ